jgi:hypothetical protein
VLDCRHVVTWWPVLPTVEHRFVGNKVHEHRGALRLSYPMEHGVVLDWQDMEKVWAHIYSREHLNVPTEEHPVRGQDPAWGPCHVLFGMVDLGIKVLAQEGNVLGPSIALLFSCSRADARPRACVDRCC